MAGITVDLFSRQIPIKTEDDAAHIQGLVELIKQTSNEIDPKGRLPEMTLAILTMLNLADDLVKERQEANQIRDAVEGKTSFLLEKLQQSGYVC